MFLAPNHRRSSKQRGLQQNVVDDFDDVKKGTPTGYTWKGKGEGGGGGTSLIFNRSFDSDESNKCASFTLLLGWHWAL
jgi:hypothetical protein